MWLVKVVAAGKPIGSGSPDVRELRNVRGTVNVDVLVATVPPRQCHHDVVVIAEYQVHPPVGIYVEIPSVARV